MRYDKENNRIHLAVTELARYAFQRENPRALAERYGFIRIADGSDLPQPPPEVELPLSTDDAETEGPSPARRGEQLHSVMETDAALISGAQTEVPLARTVMCGEYEVSVEGCADIISYDGRFHTVEEIKTTASSGRIPGPFSDPSHFAQAAVYAAMFAETAGLSELKIRLTFRKRSGGETVSY